MVREDDKYGQGSRQKRSFISLLQKRLTTRLTSVDLGHRIAFVAFAVFSGSGEGARQRGDNHDRLGPVQSEASLVLFLCKPVRQTTDRSGEK